MWDRIASCPTTNGGSEVERKLLKNGFIISLQQLDLCCRLTFAGRLIRVAGETARAVASTAQNAAARRNRFASFAGGGFPAIGETHGPQPQTAQKAAARCFLRVAYSRKFQLSFKISISRLRYSSPHSPAGMLTLPAAAPETMRQVRGKMIFQNQDPDVEIPDISLSRFVLQHAQERSNKAALVDGLSGRTISYSQLYQRVRHTAKSLTQRGYRKGDVFAIYSPNLPEYAVAFHAIATIGGVVTTLDPLCTAQDLENQLTGARAKCVITTSHFVEKVHRVESRKQVRDIFTFDQTGSAMPFAELYECVMEANEAPTNALINPREDLLVRASSSGATGGSESVMLTHFRLVADLCRVAPLDPLAAGDVFIAVAPMYHADGMFLLLCHALRHGATVVTLPRFEPESFLQTIQNHRVTRAPAPAPVVQLLANHPIVDRYDLSSLTDIYTDAAPQDAVVSRRCAERLNCIVKQGYEVSSRRQL